MTDTAAAPTDVRLTRDAPAAPLANGEERVAAAYARRELKLRKAGG